MPGGQEALAHGTSGSQRVVLFPALKQPAALSLRLPRGHEAPRHDASGSQRGLVFPALKQPAASNLEIPGDAQSR